MPLRRATLAEVQQQGVLQEGSKALRLGADEVAVVYFRAGYTPNDYPSDAEWQAPPLPPQPRCHAAALATTTATAP